MGVQVHFEVGFSKLNPLRARGFRYFRNNPEIPLLMIIIKKMRQIEYILLISVVERIFLLLLNAQKNGKVNTREGGGGRWTAVVLLLYVCRVNVCICVAENH